MKSEERIVKNTKKKKPLTRLFFLEAPPGIGPGNKGFADLCLTAWLWCRRMKKTKKMFCGKEPYIIFRFIQTALLERITGLEPATSTLARSRSTK